ncbi:MAG: hypothetical protein ACKO1N_02160 [Erythrobacter sp.]
MTQTESATTPTNLMVATPLYGGAEADYLRSVVGLVGVAERANVGCTFVWLSNNPVIDRARNMLAATFLQSDATHLVFIDGDIGFVPEELLGMVALMQADDRLAVMGAPCPKRRLNWPLIAAAAAKGLAHDNPAALERYSGVFPLEPLEQDVNFRLDAPLELTRIGTGLMVIRRDVIETLIQRHPELQYALDQLDRESGLQADRITALFQAMVDPVTAHLLSEDYAFCHRVRAAGFRIWLAPWMRTSHTGPARFAGALADLAALSTTPQPA